MGVKVSRVLDKNTREPITITDCENGYSGNYICPTEGCGADMSFVPSFEKRLLDKNNKEKTIVISSFFRLFRNQQHSEGCPYNTKSAVTIIARSSDSNVLKSLDNGKYEFSLQIVHRPTAHQSGEGVKQPAGGLPGRRVKTTTYQNKGTATSYIKTLNQILSLRAKLESNSDLEQFVKLTFEGMKIPWNEFYFETAGYINACRILASTVRKYPMCLHGWGKSISKPDGLKYPVIKLKSPYRRTTDGIKEIPVATVNVSDPNFKLSSLSEGDEILIYGKVAFSRAETLWSPKGDQDGDKIQFLNMVIWLNNKRQVVVL